jgi:hypothetical protein
MFANLIDVIAKTVHQITVEVPVQQWMEQTVSLKYPSWMVTKSPVLIFLDINTTLPSTGMDPSDF